MATPQLQIRQCFLTSGDAFCTLWPVSQVLATIVMFLNQLSITLLMCLLRLFLLKGPSCFGYTSALARAPLSSFVPLWQLSGNTFARALLTSVYNIWMALYTNRAVVLGCCLHRRAR